MQILCESRNETVFSQLEAQFTMVLNYVKPYLGLEQEDFLIQQFLL